MMENSILNKVDFLLSTSINGKYLQSDLSKIVSMLEEHTENLRIGRVFGYTVSDYAYATLKWLDTEESNNVFKVNFEKLSDKRKTEIKKLIDSKMYMHY